MRRSQSAWKGSSTSRSSTNTCSTTGVQVRTLRMLYVPYSYTLL